MKGVKNRYTTIASARKNMWNKVTYGCLCGEIAISFNVDESCVKLLPQLIRRRFFIKLLAEVFEQRNLQLANKEMKLCYGLNNN